MESANIYLASGSSHPELATAVAEEMGVALGATENRVFPAGERYSRFEDNVRRKDVFIIQSHVDTEDGSMNDMLVEQAIMADAAKRAKAASITAVVPYLGYQRQDRVTKRGEPLSAKTALTMLHASGVDHLVTIDMHSPATQGTFDGAFDHLTASKLLKEEMRALIDQSPDEEFLVAAPDAGAVKRSGRYATKLGLGLLSMAKSRSADDSSVISRNQAFPEAEGKACLIFDDMIDTAGTLVSAADVLHKSGATKIYAAATHGLLSDPAIERIKDSPIDQIIVTDTVPQATNLAALGEQLRVISVAPIIARSLGEIICGGSVSEIFDGENNS